MPSFDDDFEAADALLAEIFGGTVSLHRGIHSTTGVTAEAIARDYEVTDVEGVITTAHSRDYVINVADYAINSSVTQPRAGDRIKDTIDGTVYVFEVAPIPGRPCAEWSTTQKPQWIIHTRMVGTE